MALAQTSLQKYKTVASKKTRVQNTTDETTIKASNGLLHRIVATNANAAAQSFTLTDGATTLGVYEIQADTTLSLAFGMLMETSIKVTPGHANLDLLVIYD